MEKVQVASATITQIPLQCVFKGRLRTYRYHVTEDSLNLDICGFLDSIRAQLIEAIHGSLEEHHNLKINCFMVCDFEQPINEEIVEINFKTRNFSIYNPSDIEPFLQNLEASLLQEHEEMIARGSDWTLVRVKTMDVRINKLNPLRGGNYQALPDVIRNSKAVVSVNNSDEVCFAYALYGAFVKDHPYRLSSYTNDPEFKSCYVWNCVDYPVPLHQISRFEEINKISINVYGLTETNIVFPMRISTRDDPDARDLLLWNDHYYWITDLQRLVSRQIPYVRDGFLCKRCFTTFTSDSNRTRHERGCLIKGFQREPLQDVKIPEKYIKQNSITYVRCQPEQSFRMAFIDLMEEEEIVKYDWTHVSYAKTSFENVKKFQNDHDDVSINLYSLDAKKYVYPILVTPKECNVHKDLLYICTKSGNYFFNIPNLSRLVRSQKTLCKRQIYLCKRCLTHFYNEKKLSEHKIDCDKHQPTRYLMPDEDCNILKFHRVQHCLKLGFVIYADFESILVEPTEDFDPEANSFNYQEHKCAAYGLYVVGVDGSIREPECYKGPDAAKKFLEKLMDKVREIADIYANEKPMEPLTPKQLKDYNETTHCIICGEEFSETVVKVRDHCHITGKYRQALCSADNILLRTPTIIPVIFHGLSNYDLHFIVKELGHDPKPVKVLANSKEEYITLSIKTQYNEMEIRFIDSFRFMADSLASLAGYLEPEKLEHLSHHYPDREEFELLRRKQVLCYDHLTSFEVFNENKLPSIEKFYNRLNDEGITQDKYDHAQRVWDHFKIKNLGEYMMLYLKIDVLLLADIFENFRSLCLNDYKLDPCWFVSSPGLTWEAFLKYTKVEIELMTDFSMYSMFKSSIRGGISECTIRHIKDEPGETSIGFVDVVSLYSFAMSKSLPIRGFKWMTEDEIRNLKIEDYSEDDKLGYFLECDIEYGKDLHDRHNSMPFLVENKVPPGSKSGQKLLTNLDDKFNYPLHIRTLKQALKYGLKLTKIHRGIVFEQEKFMKPYIDFNINKRKAATNDFEKNFYKLLNNSAFGKTMEDKEKRMNFEIVTSEKRFEKVVAMNTFQSATVFAENVVGILKQKTRIYLDKPIFVGASILDLSKVHIYGIYYGHYRRLYGDKCEKAYMDTDSLVLRFKGGLTLQDDIRAHPSLYDTSDYPIGHPLRSTANKKVPGTLTDEANGSIINEFIGLKSKVYALDINGKEKRRCKGVKKYVIQKDLHLEKFRAIVTGKSANLKCQQNHIRSKNHNIFSVSVSKLALTSKDDKRFILGDNVHTLAHGHFRVKEHKEKMKTVLEDIPRGLKRQASQSLFPENSKKPRV